MLPAVSSLEFPLSPPRDRGSAAATPLHFDSEPLPCVDPELLFGRDPSAMSVAQLCDRILEQVDEFMAGFYSKHTSYWFLVESAAGSGKTRLAREVRKRIEAGSAPGSEHVMTLLHAMTQEGTEPGGNIEVATGFQLLTQLLYQQGAGRPFRLRDIGHADSSPQRIQQLLRQMMQKQPTAPGVAADSRSRGVLLLFLDDAHLAPASVKALLYAARGHNFGNGHRPRPQVAILPFVLCRVSPLDPQRDAALMGAVGWMPWNGIGTIRRISSEGKAERDAIGKPQGAQ